MPGSLGIRQEISKAFKLHGYSLKVEASRHLEQLLTPIQDRSKWIEAILDTLGKNVKLIEHYTNAGFDFLGLFDLKSTAGLPLHYQTTKGCCLFEIKL